MDESWQEKLPGLIQKIESARQRASVSNGIPKLNHRLSVGGRDAALLKVTSTDLGTPPNGSFSVLESEEWSPSSWIGKPMKQEVVYTHRAAVEQALAELESLPPIVTPYEIIKLRKSLQDVALGKSLVLHGGDCAELFSYCEANTIQSKIKLLLQMSLILIWGSNKPVVRIGRMAGQYAKPRSKPTEIVNGVEIPTFRGDILNGYDVMDREPDPRRLVKAYHYSAATLNHVRALMSSGFADLRHPLNWELGHVRDRELRAKYERIADSIQDSLRFMRTIGADTSGQLETIDLYTSHEGLLLEFEQSLTRKLPQPGNYRDLEIPRTSTTSLDSTIGKDREHGFYNTSAHFLWIGDRTRQLNGAHVEYFRGLENPIGVKVGPNMTAEELVELLNILNPLKEVGKVTLITRYGEGKINEILGSHIDAVMASGHIPVWQCDPMHGNTKSTATGIKTRHFSAIFNELEAALRIHANHGSYLGGVHLELTGDAVTECMGGGEGLMEDDLNLNYTTYCDPRLNERQALELAFLVAEHFRKRMSM